MVVGIGIDIVEIDRITQALQESSTMAQRVFTPTEIDYCDGRRNRYQHFAGRFAAKEAALKALGTGWQKGIRWKDVEVTDGPLGRPELSFHGRALETFRSLDATRALVTITHARQYAVAVVVLDRVPQRE